MSSDLSSLPQATPSPALPDQPPPVVPPAAQMDDDPMPVPKLKIGSQRPGAGKMQAKPQTRPQAEKAPEARHFPPPNKRQELPPDLELELAEALGGMSLDEIVGVESPAAAKTEVELEGRYQAKIVKIHRDDVFLEFGQRNQGVLSLRQFTEAPPLGAIVDVIVHSFDAEEGLYQLTKPGVALAVADWSDLAEGVLVEARITGENKGGLECEVNNIRGFIPASQASIYRIENLAQLVGERLLCVVTEANPDKRNLVLSRRAVMEREQAEAKEKLLLQLEPGQIVEGVVRSIRDFGAFVDLGGVDGLLHVSQLGWARVKHPSEVLQEGQTVKVKIQKIDPDTKKISLGMRDLLENPWTTVGGKYPVRSRIEGTVTKIMDFGCFVQLEPGIEGLVHISELAHKRVFRVSDVVKEGDKVEAQVLSVDAEKQRISLSIKAVQAKPVAAQPDAPMEEEPETPAVPANSRKTPLKGGIGRSSEGDKFGLNW